MSENFSPSGPRFNPNHNNYNHAQQPRARSLRDFANQPPPGPQEPFPGQQPPRREGPAFLERPAQMIRGWTSKMNALRQPTPPVDPGPQMRYRQPQPPMPAGAFPDQPGSAYQQPWHVSRAQRVTRLVRKRRERFGSNGKRIGKIITSILLGLVLVLLVSGTISVYADYQSQLPRVQDLANQQIPQSSRMYDRNGKLLYTFYDGKYGRSTPVSYNHIPGFMQDAQIAAEDKTFWTNSGVDFQATLRSALEDATSHQIKTGASTLTQQVIKNLTGNGQVTPQRKINEALLAMGLTQQYPKWKILEMYFNIAPYGGQEQGIEAAAQDFFGLKPQCDAHFKCTPAIAFLDRDLTKCKTVADEATCAVDPILGLARASLMAGIPQNPLAFDPINNADNLQALYQRQDYVLGQMMSDGMSINLGLGSQAQPAEPITPQIIQQTETITKNIKFTGFQGGDSAPHFVRWVQLTLATSLGKGDYNAGLSILERSGLNIRTTLDSNLETYVESALTRHIDKPEVQPFMGNFPQTLSKSDNLHDSAAVVMDAKTGEVLAMDGSVDWNDTSTAGSGQVNMALAPRQPGSSFKPIVLATAYEMGWYPGIVVPDFKTYFPKGLSTNLPAQTSTYVPQDYGKTGTYHNQPTNIAQAIANSYNIPALKMQDFAGLQNVYNMAARLGITSINPQKDLVPSMALGVDAVSLLQMVGAYQTFANQGTRIPPHNILDIWDNYGHNLYHYDPTHPDGASVLSPQVAYLVTSTLDNETLRAAEFGNDHVLSMWDWRLPDGTHPDVASKTGTTDSFKDNWTLGYTPDVVVGVWSGNADDSPMVNSIGVTGAAPIWHSIIEYISGKCNTASDQIACPPLDFNYTDRHFILPDGVVQHQVNTANGLAGTGYTSYMLVNEVPQQSGHLQSGCNPAVNNCRPGHKRRH